MRVSQPRRLKEADSHRDRIGREKKNSRHDDWGELAVILKAFP